MKICPANAVLFLLLLCCRYGYAQDYAMLHYKMDEGLPGNTIYNIFKDSRGYLWLCSDKGIARYNGIRFETFTTFDGLPDNEIFFFNEDHDGRIWLATFNGELCYYQDGKFHTAANTPFLKLPFRKPFIQDIMTGADGSVTIGFHDRQNWVDIKNGKIRVLSFAKIKYNAESDLLYVNKKPDNKFELALHDRKVWMDSNGHVLYERPYRKNKTYRHSRSPKQLYLYTADSIYSIDEEPLAAMNKEVYLKNNLYHFHCFDGSYFYCTDKGLFIDNDIHLLKEHKVSGCEQNDEGNFWISTLDDGLYSMSKDFRTIKKYKNIYEGIVKFSAADSNYIFFTTDKDRFFRFGKNNTECLFDYRRHNRSAKRASDQANVIDRDGNYYGFFDGTVAVINAAGSKPTKKIYHRNLVVGYKAAFSDGRYQYLKRYKSIEQVCLSKGTAGGNKKNEGYPHKQYDALNKNQDRIFGMAIAPDNTLWYSTIDSIYQLKNGQSISQPQFGNLSFKWFDFSGSYMIGCTHDNKLGICNNMGHVLYTSIVENQNCIWNKLYKLDSNHILINTNNLYRILTIIPSQGKPIYSIQAIENPYIPTRAEDICYAGNTCYFFKDGNITSIDLNSLLKRPDPPRLSFDYLKTAGKVYPVTRDIELPFDQSRNISISYSTLAFSGKDVVYQYALSKSDHDNWTDISGDINLLHPGYGEYMIKLRARSISSGYSLPAVFTLHILRPFWATWWFIILAVCLLLCLAVFIIRRRMLSMVHKKQREHENEIRFIKSEYKALNALMNPHFIFNTLNNVQDLINKNDKRAANQYLRYFADLVRQNMQNVSKELIPLQKEVELVSNYLLLEKLRFEDSLEYTIEIDEELDLSEIMVPPLLIQPLVENSIKHGIFPMASSNGRIWIKIFEEEDLVHIEVMDNGPGMTSRHSDHASSHESFGLEGIRKRMEQLSIIQEKEFSLHTGSIKNEIDGLQWTKITVSIPLPACS